MKGHGEKGIPPATHVPAKLPLLWFWGEPGWAHMGGGGVFPSPTPCISILIVTEAATPKPGVEGNGIPSLRAQSSSPQNYIRGTWERLCCRGSLFPPCLSLKHGCLHHCQHSCRGKEQDTLPHVSLPATPAAVLGELGWAWPMQQWGFPPFLIPCMSILTAADLWLLFLELGLGKREKRPPPALQDQPNSPQDPVQWGCSIPTCTQDSWKWYPCGCCA